MIKHYITNSSNADEILLQDYEAILNEASTELSEIEYRHLADIANIGYEYATQKDDYLDALHDTICAWSAEARRLKLHVTHGSTEIDFLNWYNTDEVTIMKPNHNLDVIPSFFVCFGAVCLALFCVFVTIFLTSAQNNSFPFNPVYLFMFTVGFFGLLLTDIVAIAEWRKQQNEQR